MKHLEEIRIDLSLLRAARGKRRQTHVAREIGITRQRLHDYESGRVGIPSDILARLCRAYGVNITEIDTGPKSF